MSVKPLLMMFIPRSAVMAFARAARWYTLHAPFRFGKRSILLGHSVFRLFARYKIDDDVTTRVGIRMHVTFPDMLQRSLFFLGVWEPAITAFVRKSLGHGDVFVDVGANIGYYSCLASKLTGPRGEVHAIEPSPSLRRALDANLGLNKAVNVQVHEVAVMDRDTEVTIYLGPEWALGRSTVLEQEAGSRFSRESQVRALPLQRVVNPEALFRARLVKIDVEGAEWRILRALFNQLHRFREATEWIVEVTPDSVRRDGGSVGEIIEGFAHAGYRAYRLENPYDVDWLLRRGEKLLDADFDELVQPLPDNPGSLPQLDLLFSRHDYGNRCSDESGASGPNPAMTRPPAVVPTGRDPGSNHPGGAHQPRTERKRGASG